MLTEVDRRSAEKLPVIGLNCAFTQCLLSTLSKNAVAEKRITPDNIKLQLNY
jgi:hypothetical protein